MPSRYWARNRRGTAARKPAIGPAAPISAIARFLGKKRDGKLKVDTPSRGAISVWTGFQILRP